MLSLLCLICTI